MKNIGFGIGKTEWEALDDVATSLYTDDKYNRVIDGAGGCDAIREVIGYNRPNYVIWEVPLDNLEELEVVCGDVTTIPYGDLEKIKTNEYSTLVDVVDLLNTATDFSNIEESMYIIVDTASKVVKGGKTSFK